jgi:hypothetical protein
MRVQPAVSDPAAHGLGGDGQVLGDLVHGQHRAAAGHVASRKQRWRRLGRPLPGRRGRPGGGHRNRRQGYEGEGGGGALGHSSTVPATFLTARGNQSGNFSRVYCKFYSRNIPVLYSKKLDRITFRNLMQHSAPLPDAALCFTT